MVKLSSVLSVHVADTVILKKKECNFSEQINHIYQVGLHMHYKNKLVCI